MSVRAAALARSELPNPTTSQVITTTTPTQVPTTGPQSRQLPDGSVVHVVRSDDTLFIIALDYGVTVDQLLQLNHLQPGDYIRIGQELIVKGPAQLATPTVGAKPSAQPTAVPTLLPTAVAVTLAPSELCLRAFNDHNGNGVYDENEELVANVRFTALTGNEVVVTYTTNGIDEPRCFTNLTQGAYIVRVELPPGYVSTTDEQVGAALASGQTASVAFGVRLPSAKSTPRATPVGSSQTARVFVRYGGALIGALLIVGLGGLVIFRRK